MTRWAFAVAEIAPLGDEPVALVKKVMETDAGCCIRLQRQRWRRQVLTALVGNALGLEDHAVVLVAGDNGLRRLAGQDVYASVSHRANWVAAVLSRAPVGIDIEQPEQADAAAEVVLAGVDRPIDLVAWCGLAGVWAAREAVLKAQGRDLARDYLRWHFGNGWVRGDDGLAVRVDLAAHPGIVAAVAYAGD